MSLVVLPCESVHVYWRVTATDASLPSETVKLAALTSVTDVWSDVMVTVRLRVLAVDVGDEPLEPSALWALTLIS